MNKIKSFIKREKFLSACILLIIAILLFILVYSYFPRIENQNGNTYVIFGGWNPKNAEGKALNGMVIFLDESEEKHVEFVSYRISLEGVRSKDFPEEKKKQHGYCEDLRRLAENGEQSGYCEHSCGFYAANVKWEHKGEVVEDTITLKFEYVKIYLSEVIE